MKKVVALLVGCGLLGMVGCASSGSSVTNAGFTGEHGPAVSYDTPGLGGCLVSSITHPETIRGSQAELGPKVGKSSASSILGLIATGDSSVATAAKNGGITKIKTADVHVNTVLLGLYTEVTTIVTGE